MDNKKLESCLAACKKSVDATQIFSTKNKGVAGMENCIKLCITTKDACNELITASKNKAKNLIALYKKTADASTASATECAKHPNMTHSKECADACKKTAAECKAMLTVAA